MSEATPRTGTGKKLAFSMLSLLVFLGAAEGIYRVATAPDPNAADGFDHEWRERYIRMNETIYRPSDNPRLVYEPTPSSSVDMEYGAAGFNAQGMRETRDVSAESGDDTRVLVIGDSLVWTEFVATEEAIPQQLDVALGEGFEALNFGVTGYDTSDEAAWYEAHARNFDADIVVVVFCMNDLMIMSGPFERYADEEDRARKDAQEALIERLAPVRRETIDDVVHHNEKYAWFKLWARFEGILIRRDFDDNYDDEYLVMSRQEPARARFENAISRFGRDIQADDATPVLVISPVLESFDDYHWQSMHAYVKAQAEEAGFVVFDPLPRWQRELAPEQLRISGDNLHYGVEGSRIFSEDVATFLQALPANERPPQNEPPQNEPPQ